MLRFLLDENIPYSLYRFLKKQKYDVLRAQDIQRSLPDIKLLEIAKSESRILVTLDKDFARLYLLEPEATIVLIDIHPPFPGDVVSAFTRLLEVKGLLETPGLIVVGKKMVRKIKV